MAVYEKKEEEGQKRTDAAAIGRRYHCDFLNEWITALNEWAPFLSECHCCGRPARKFLGYAASGICGRDAQCRIVFLKFHLCVPILVLAPAMLLALSHDKNVIAAEFS